MFLDRFHSVQDGHVVISALQASQFAKEIAGDFNPIHDPDARRFCVPGDLLFAIVLARFGLSENMTFRFRSLLGENVPLKFVETEDTIESATMPARSILKWTAVAPQQTTNS